MSSTPKTDPEEHNREDEENAPAADDEDTGAQVAPIVKLEEVAVSTGEEDEDPILDLVAVYISSVNSVLVMIVCASNCKSFMETVQEVAESQGKKEENKDATDTADLLEKLSVGENKGDEKEKEEKCTAAEDKEAVESKAKTEADKEDESASKA
ncbi:putative ran binding protein [Corchorus capsularis]|uniref:Putative ran binding protein n=1 Tax=Corchorus capsularis TaxID=210143 RepID=A0A1R3IR71_COCAP|nr:putative ran binding protein [Corchorus capsularis]